MEKKIIQCPSCSGQLRVPAGRNLVITCPTCNHIFQHNDSSSFAGQPYGSNQDSNATLFFIKKYWKHFLVGIVGMVFLIKGCNRYAEKQFFDRVASNSKDMKIYYQFFQTYPDGGHYQEELKIFEDTMSYRLAHSAMGTSIYECDSIQTYLDRHPNGLRVAEANKDLENCLFTSFMKYGGIKNSNVLLSKFPNNPRIAEVKEKTEKVWATVIQNYEKQANFNHTGISQKAFFKDLLLYLKENHSSDIAIEIKGTSNLKEWDEFDPKAKDLLDQLVDLSNSMEKTKLPKPSENKPISTNLAFSYVNRKNQEEKIRERIKAQLINILGNGFSLTEKVTPEKPVIQVNYEIKNQLIGKTKDGIEVPSVYNHYRVQESAFEGEYPKSKSKKSKNNNGIQIFQGYLLGVGIDWHLEVQIPNYQKKNYTFDTHSNPASSITGIQDIADGYQKMLQTSFDNFSDDVLHTFGIAAKATAKEQKEEEE
jgi:hypothetical protein